MCALVVLGESHCVETYSVHPRWQYRIYQWSCARSLCLVNHTRDTVLTVPSAPQVTMLESLAHTSVTPREMDVIVNSRFVPCIFSRVKALHMVGKCQTVTSPPTDPVTSRSSAGVKDIQ